MGRYFRFENGVESMLSLPKILQSDGELVAPRRQETRELRDVMIEIDNPTDPTMVGIGRRWSHKIAVAEFLQLAGGFSDPQVMKQIAPTFERFMNGGVLHGAYGPRLSMQFPRVLERLLSDPMTRQAVVTIWDPLHDMMQNDRADIPCTVSLTFAIRNDLLHMTTHMRSNDIWWGWSYDLFQFTQLQCTVANFLGVEPGSYVHFTNSLHLYTRDEDKVNQLYLPNEYDTRAELAGIGSVDCWGWESVQERARALFYGTPLADDDMTVTEAWMSEVMDNARDGESPVVE